MNPHEELERQLAEARRAYQQARARQAGRREEAEERLRAARSDLAALDEEVAPLDDQVKKLGAELEHRNRRTLGPWVVARQLRWPDAQLYLHGSARAWHASRAWLRVVSGDLYQWEARIWIDSIRGNLDLVLGPPSQDPEADLAAHKKVVEAKLRELGWYVVEGEDPAK